MTTQTALKHILIGTAGHIDHGKTRLIARLTGIDTDRLPEEKSRGISIDLGFAHWEADGYQFGVVDVPGHERFVKNMVAGATGINLALLVVAADDGVMPQTREHLDIMDLLGVRAGVVAITKTDLVDAEFVELVQAEVEDLVQGTFLEGAAVVPVSSETGEGVEELRDNLLEAAGRVEETRSAGFFRMPVDRVFSITGHGTIVTGSVISGEVRAGETLELLPEGESVRVRSVETHGALVEDSGARRRTAVNLAGVKADTLRRGQELATPGYLRAARRLLVEIRTLPGAPLTLKDRMRLNLHVGTAETPARVILKGKKLKPGERAFAELRLKEPVVATYGQRFILRRISPALTVAGGTILDPGLPLKKRIKDLDARADPLANGTAQERLRDFLAQRDLADASPAEVAWKIGLAPEVYERLMGELESNGELTKIASGGRILRTRLESVAASVLRTIKAELERHQPRRALPKPTLLQACREIAGGEILEAAFAHLLKTKQLVEVGSQLGPADMQVKLSKKQQALRNTLLERIEAGGLSPPTSKEIAAEVNESVKDLEPLLNLCVEDGLLVKLSDVLYFTPDALETARRRCAELLETQGEATASQLREVWGNSRKFAVPLCEYFDAVGVTVREGDLRRAGPRASTPLEAT